jgi:hypothetical protein
MQKPLLQRARVGPEFLIIPGEIGTMSSRHMTPDYLKPDRQPSPLPQMG